MRILVVGFIYALLTGCAGLAPAQLPDLRLESTHLFGVTRIAFSPDGQRIASGGFKGDLAVWQVPDGATQGRFKPHRDAVRGLQWIDNQQLISAAEDGLISVTDVLSGQQIRQKQTDQVITALTYLAQQASVIVGDQTGRLQRFSYPDFYKLNEISLEGEILSLATDTTQRHIAVSTSVGRVLVLDSQLGLVQELQRPGKRALELRFSPTGNELAAGAWYQVYYWDLASGAMREQSTESWGAITSLDYSPSGDHVITLGRHTDASLRLVDNKTGQVLRRLMGHRLCGAAVRFSPDGRYIASGSDDESVRLYDLTKPYRPQKPGDDW